MCSQTKEYHEQKDVKLEIYGHHECHSLKHLLDMNQMALVISIDGGGFDLQNNEMFELHTGAWHGKTDSAGKKEVNPILLDKQLSFGSIYNFTTRLLGFSTGYPKGSQAGSVMGMAAWGSSRNTHLFEDEFIWQNTSAKNQKRDEAQSEYFEDKVTAYLQGGKSENEILKLKFNIAADFKICLKKD